MKQNFTNSYGKIVVLPEPLGHINGTEQGTDRSQKIRKLGL